MCIYLYAKFLIINFKRDLDTIDGHVLGRSNSASLEAAFKEDNRLASVGKLFSFYCIFVPKEIKNWNNNNKLISKKNWCINKG